MTENITIKQLMAKARGFTMSIEKMNESQRNATVNSKYGEDYNNLRARTEELLPDLAPLLPPTVDIIRASGSSNVTYTNESFGEISTYCEQIFQLLSEQT